MAQEVPGHRHRMGQALGFLLQDIAHPVALESLPDIPFRFRGDHHPDILYARLQEVFQAIVEDGPSRHPDHRLGPGVGEGAEPGAPPSRQNESFHGGQYTLRMV